MVSWKSSGLTKKGFFESTSKRRRGYPSEMQVKRGVRIVHGDKRLDEKLGRNDPCPCGSARSFQALLPHDRMVSMDPIATNIPDKIGSSANMILRVWQRGANVQSVPATTGTSGVEYSLCV